MGKSHANGFLDLVNDAKTRVRECTTVDVKEWQDAERSFFLVDVREDTEWAMAHLPGAVHLGKGVIERDIEKVIPDHEAEIVLYCGGGYRSALTCDAAQKMGYTNVKSLENGYKGMIASDWPMDS